MYGSDAHVGGAMVPLKLDQYMNISTITFYIQVELATPRVRAKTFAQWPFSANHVSRRALRGRLGYFHRLRGALLELHWPTLGIELPRSLVLRIGDNSLNVEPK